MSKSSGMEIAFLQMPLSSVRKEDENANWQIKLCFIFYELLSKSSDAAV